LGPRRRGDGLRLDTQIFAKIVLTLVPLILSICVHEFAHAFAADKLGDDLPARQGRLTLNPMAHIDPIGTLLIPALSIIFPLPLFGWGRPVETIPTSYTRKVSLRGGEALVAFAGPFSNLLMAVVCGGLYVALSAYGVIEHGSPFQSLLLQMTGLNLTLFFFNLVPVPPLDGSKIVAWVFGYRADKALDMLAKLGPLALYLAVAVLGSTIGLATTYVFRLIIGGFMGLLT
jgi:Zn-dependent protease